jgi:hypothetical protein
VTSTTQSSSEDSIPTTAPQSPTGYTPYTQTAHATGPTISMMFSLLPKDTLLTYSSIDTTMPQPTHHHLTQADGPNNHVKKIEPQGGMTRNPHPTNTMQISRVISTTTTQPTTLPIIKTTTLSPTLPTPQKPNTKQGKSASPISSLKKQIPKKTMTLKTWR